MYRNTCIILRHTQAFILRHWVSYIDYIRKNGNCNDLYTVMVSGSVSILPGKVTLFTRNHFSAKMGSDFLSFPEVYLLINMCQIFFDYYNFFNFFFSNLSLKCTLYLNLITLAFIWILL